MSVREGWSPPTATPGDIVICLCFSFTAGSVIFYVLALIDRDMRSTAL
jgi:hypothetical protein